MRCLHECRQFRELLELYREREMLLLQMLYSHFVFKNEALLVRNLQIFSANAASRHRNHVDIHDHDSRCVFLVRLHRQSSGLVYVLR